jgi:hypothetical protein
VSQNRPEDSTAPIAGSADGDIAVTDSCVCIARSSLKMSSESRGARHGVSSDVLDSEFPSSDRTREGHFGQTAVRGHLITA